MAPRSGIQPTVGRASAAPAPDPAGHAPLAAARALSAGLIAGLVMALSALSFSALIFSGPLAPFRGEANGLVLYGALAFALLGAVFARHGGAMWQSQSVAAVALAAGAQALAARMPEAAPAPLFATVLALVVVSTLSSGLLLLAFGGCRLGNLARFIPHPVLGGFLAATAALLILKGIVLAAGPAGASAAPSDLLKLDAVRGWSGPFALAVIAAWFSASRRFRMALPVALALYGGLAALGHAQAIPPAGSGGPTGAAVPAALRLATLPGLVDADALLGAAPVVATVALLVLFAAILNIAGLEAGSDQAAGINLDRELRRAGFANVVAGLVGGLPGFHSPSLSHLVGGIVERPGRLAGLGAAGSVALVLLAGNGLISLLPRGIFGLILIYVGAGMAHRWLWQSLRRWPARDCATILLILAATLAFGFVTAIGVGFVLAMLQFVIAYARVDVLRSAFTGRERPSSTERPPAVRRLLAAHGAETLIFELQGYLFFGSTQRLSERLSAQIAAADPRPRWIVLCLRRVTGMDISTALMLARAARAARRIGADLVFTDLSPAIARELRRATALETARLFDTLDDALVWLEEQRLADASPGDHAAGAFATILDQAQQLPGGPVFATRRIAAGSVVLTEGEPAESMLYLAEGQMTATRAADANAESGRSFRVARFLPGTIIGEIGFLTNGLRTATITADTDGEVVVITRPALDQLMRIAPDLGQALQAALLTLLAERLQRTTALAQALR
ncbi:MAG: cyclic nucleotide-binding domain-containing protein [Limimaricola sp.]|uniref:cyclic nucleotide-binding domain-containing protein n=1 Tax=Limimaricola sp. TaxID=2211665 RepID=UPI001D951080|nr:cyclic nucleotide-binding domain-containing protein [Limimaricola sp.]MBI1416212.1 cyclic nucleotide-binding domain-containing protein [Limimaricola sp.]